MMMMMMMTTTTTMKMMMTMMMITIMLMMMMDTMNQCDKKVEDRYNHYLRPKKDVWFLLPYAA